MPSFDPVRQRSSTRLLVLGYAVYVVIGWIALSLPFAQARPVPTLDTLFTATSAVSTTGLSTVATHSHFTRFGQCVVLLLIQLGGIGYMTFGSFVVLSRHHRISERRVEVARRAFALPEGMGILHFLRNVVVFTFAIEALGALVLWYHFAAAGVESPLFQGVFHSVSAFCTAGFSLFGDGLQPFRDHFWVNATVGALSIGGAVGFIVFTDVAMMLTGRRPRLSLTSRTILWFVPTVIVVGAVLVFLGEDSLAGMPPHERWLAAFFQCMSATTTVGFNTLPVDAWSASSITLVVLLMLIGASPSGTGGGVKVTTVATMLAVVRSTMRGRAVTTIDGTRIPHRRVLAAGGTVTLYLGVLFAAVYVLTSTESHDVLALIFEAASALGTVGLSLGITSDLTPLGKLAVIAVMFLGRVGPITLATALFVDASDDHEEQSDLAV